MLSNNLLKKDIRHKLIFIHDFAPLLFSNEETVAFGSCFVDEPGVFILRTTVVADSCTVRFFTYIGRVLISYLIVIFAIYIKSNIKLPISEKNNFSNFVQFMQDNLVRMLKPWLHLLGQLSDEFRINWVIKRKEGILMWRLWNFNADVKVKHFNERIEQKLLENIIYYFFW